MVSPSVTEGYIDFEVPSISRVCQTYYKIIGTLAPGVRPFIALHGGPGCNSEYLEILSDVTDGQPNPLILYDQIGGGLSTHLPEKNGDTSFWTIQLFIDELNNLLRKLNITEYDLLGHSWGGTLAVSYAVQQPQGLRNLILFSCDASTQLLEKGQIALRAKLPKEVRAALERYEEDGKVTPEYKKAKVYYNKHHMCTLDPMPQAIARAFEWAAKDPTVPTTMYGPSTFKATGPMKDWTVIEDLHKIQVPTLIVNGAHDCIVDSAIAPFVEKIPNVKWVQFQKSSHMAHYEERPEFMQTVRNFLYPAVGRILQLQKATPPSPSHPYPNPAAHYYKIIGPLNPGVPPLIAIHGGPSISSEYLETLDTTQGHPNPRALILYDQLGSARSTLLPEKLSDEAFWTVQLFIDELKNLIAKLGITEFDLLGHSWGGTLALSFAVQAPPGLKHLIIFSSQPSTKHLVEGHEVLKSTMPKEIQEAFDRYEDDGVVTPEYRKANEYYQTHHTCKVVPMPDPIVRAFAWGAKDATVQLTMFGRGTFRIDGPMKDWSVVDQLSNIRVPTLVINGADDSCRDTAIAPFVEKISDVRWVKFANSSHMAHFEERPKFMQTLRDFLYHT